MSARQKREMDAINRELRHMPFGNDTYKFVMKEKPTALSSSASAGVWKNI